MPVPRNRGRGVAPVKDVSAPPFGGALILIGDNMTISVRVPFVVVNKQLVESRILKNAIFKILTKTNNGTSYLENELDTEEVVYGDYTVIFSWDDVVILNNISHCGCSVVNEKVIWDNIEFLKEFVDYVERTYGN